MTAEEASELGGLLRRVWSSSPRRVRVSVRYAKTAVIALDGVVDWKAGVGQADLTMSNPTTEEAPADLGRWTWKGQEVAMPLTPAQSALAKAIGLTPAPQAVAVPMQTSTPLHLVLEVVSSLGNERAENPLLLRERARLLRSDRVRGTEVRVFAVGERTQYWLDARGDLVRMVAQVNGFAGAVRVDLLAGKASAVHEPREVAALDQLPPELRDQLSHTAPGSGGS